MAEKEALEKNFTDKLENTKTELTNKFAEQLDSLKKDNEAQLETQKVEISKETKRVEESLKHSQIDLNSANEKIGESLKDYKNSITKLKTASNQRYVKLKKKFTNSLAALNIINSGIFDNDAEENLLKPLLASLTFNDKVKNQNEGESPVTGDEEPSVDYEFNENKFKEYIESKREKLENNPALTEKIDACKSKESELTQELEQLKKESKDSVDKLTKTESKFKVNYRLFTYILCWSFQ